FVTDQLGAGAQAADKAVFVVGRPAAENEGVNCETGNRKNEDDANVDMWGDNELITVTVLFPVFRRRCFILSKGLLVSLLLFGTGRRGSTRPLGGRGGVRGTERDDREGEKGGGDGDGRGSQEQQLVDVARDDVFFEQEF